MSLEAFTITISVAAMLFSLLVRPFTRAYFNLLKMFSVNFFEQERCWRSFWGALGSMAFYGALLAAPFALMITLGDHRLWNIAHPNANLGVTHVHLPQTADAVFRLAARRYLIGLPGFFAFSAAAAFVLRLLATMELERHRKVLMAVFVFLVLSGLAFWWAFSVTGH